MKNVFKTAIASLVLGSALLAGSAAAATLTSCTLTNGKQVSVDLQKNGDFGYALYNKQGVEELVLQQDDSTVYAFSHYETLRTGDFWYIRFHKGVYDYVVTALDDGQNPSFDGLFVLKNGKKIATLTCDASGYTRENMQQAFTGTMADDADSAQRILDIVY
ncbi:hypothetical protein BF283_003354 [Escherichia coli]|nr:hypothetical protein [Escherichia coli]